MSDLFPSDEDKYLYLITIRKCQVLHKVGKTELEDIIVFLIDRGVSIREYFHETHGKYMQQHTHAIAHYYNSSYSGLTKSGDFRIHWKKIKNNLYKVRQYIRKNQPKIPNKKNLKKIN